MPLDTLPCTGEPPQQLTSLKCQKCRPSAPQKWNVKTQLMKMVAFLFHLCPAQFFILHETLAILIMPGRPCTLPPASRRFFFAPQLMCCSLSSFWLSLQMKPCYWRRCSPRSCHQLQITLFSIWTATRHLGNEGEAGEFNEAPSYPLR